MKVKYKTSLKCDGCVGAIKSELDQMVGQNQWQVDLNTDNGSILTIEEIDESQLEKVFKKHNYTLERMN